jgi:Zn-finger nucleic acid-binding protein/DNA-directed RNA polymerase subunit RPC12/RpoP
MGLDSNASHLRVLVACYHCKRQYEASTLKVGNRFRCTCGSVITVNPINVRDAAVVSCSSCGAARQTEENTCAYCGSVFTLHEQDLNTVCPKCMARISDRAKFCHFCATPIVPQGTPGEHTDFPCPACGKEQKLSSRTLDNDNLSMLECGSCAGLWLNSKVFQLLQERASAASIPDDGFEQNQYRGHGEQSRDRHGRFYRACPICSTLMLRRNFGRRSGVLVDSCKAHGIWFDRGELDTILRWIRSGGLMQAQRLEIDHLRKQHRLNQAIVHQPSPWTSPSTHIDAGSFISAIVDIFTKT